LRELLIISDGEDVRDLLPNDPSIRLVHVAERRTIGEKRNVGCGFATGEVICHWDDDDWSEPKRLEDQITRLVVTNAAVTGYHSMRFTDGSKWWKYEGQKVYALGTSLCYRKAWWERHQFPAKNVGEDNAFVSLASAENQLVSADAGAMMWASIHVGNTSPRMLGKNWRVLLNEYA
jgi:O-antigen biosynthesis protein